MQVVLIDISGIAHPIWHVSGQDPDPDHVSTATIARVRQIASGYDHVVVCCDSRKSFRRELAPDYKANREAKPESLFYQIDRAKQVLSAEYPVLKADGFEADDVIATCVRLLSAVEELEEIVVASSDKDLCQLVRGVDPDGRLPSVRILSLATNEFRGVIEVRCKFGVAPAQMGDWLALVGDTSDNVKGCPGIGDKKASALLTQFGNLVGVYGRLQGISSAEEWAKLFNGGTVGRLIGGPAVYAALSSKENQQAVALARKLVELRTDVPLTLEQVLAKPEPKPLSQAQLEQTIDAAIEWVKEAAEPLSREEFLAAQKQMETETMTQQIVDRQTGEVTEVQTQVQVQTESKPEPAPNINGKSELSRMLAGPVTFERALEPTSSQGAIVIAGHLFASHMFSKFPNADAVLGAILLGRELGIGAMGSLRGLNLIEGKYAITADLLVALVLRSNLCEYFEPVEQTASKSVWRCKRIGRAEQKYTFEISDAEKAKLVKKDSGWEKHPSRMCSARAKAFLSRDIFPDITFGLYTPEELES